MNVASSDAPTLSGKVSDVIIGVVFTGGVSLQAKPINPQTMSTGTMQLANVFILSSSV
jgi:hypothetical protein